MSVETIHVPDVGSSDPVDVIEVPVKKGDTIAPEDTIVVLESDKATVEVPSPMGGTVTELLVKQGDRVTEGDPLMKVEAEESPRSGQENEQDSGDSEDAGEPSRAGDKQQAKQEKAEKNDDQAARKAGGTETVPVKVPELGDIDSAELIEFQVSEGDEVEEEQVIAVLESDKASVEIPSPSAGRVTKLVAKVGSSLGTGDVLMEMEVQQQEQQQQVATAGSDSQEQNQAQQEEKSQTEPASGKQATSSRQRSKSAERDTPEQSGDVRRDEGKPSDDVHAGPAVRKLAREMGVDLARVSPSGPKSRVLKEDVHAYVKKTLSGGPAPAGAGPALELPEIDFGKWGEIETEELSRLRRSGASNLHRSWLTIPHVTQHDEADVTELERFRKEQNRVLEKQGVKLTMLAFLVQACARALKEFPRFNTSLSVDGGSLIHKHYVHIGIAVDTPNGLVVPVLRDADRKGIIDIARELGELSQKARDKKLSPGDMQGGTFSISSLGGIGGTSFTPVVNWPEVAILGVSRMQTQPVWDGEQFRPRLMLPLSLSYDHRVVDGADAARFTTYLSGLLTDLRRALL